MHISHWIQNHLSIYHYLLLIFCCTSRYKHYFNFAPFSSICRSKHYRYFYAITSDVDDSDSAGKVYKVDTLTGEVKSFYEENTYCAEPYFVARPGSVAEDDGVLISSMIRGVPEISWTGLIVLDAKDLKEIARAEFQLKSPVPKPLHGCFGPFKKND